MDIVSEAAREEYLRMHLEERYNVRVMSLQRLDKGVFGVTLGDGRRWIVRVFPAKRSVEQVEGDVAILQFLEQQSFPAERCATDSPVSILYGRAILVTQYVEGIMASESKFSLSAPGEMLARLNRLPTSEGATGRPAGALHHYSQIGGGPQNDLLAARTFLTEISNRIPEQSRPLYESLWEKVAHADTCDNLPKALIHPDPVLKNLLVTGNRGLIFIDWTGAGCGPRIASLAVLLNSCALQKGGWSPRRVDMVVAGYRSHICLEEEELLRLTGVIRIRPLVFACWRYRRAVLAEHVPDGSEWWWPDEELTQAIATRACDAFRNGTAKV